MTPEIYAKVAPYLTTHGIGAVNINTAPIPVLRALPGMTDATINMIVQQRSQGRRINSIGDILSTGRNLAGMLSAVQLQTAIAGRVVYQTTEVELSITSRVGPQAPPSRLTAILRRGNPVSVTFKEW
jgi:type II secretory pathway component PulK